MFVAKYLVTAIVSDFHQIELISIADTVITFHCDCT